MQYRCMSTPYENDRFECEVCEEMVPERIDEPKELPNGLQACTRCFDEEMDALGLLTEEMGEAT
jgi:hypothetical protein